MNRLFTARRRPALLGVALAGVLLPTMVACGSDSATEDADLVVYSGRNEELVGDFIEAFEKEQGIKVEVRYGDTAELAAQLLEEGERTPAQVFFSQDAGALGALDSEGLLSSLDPALTAKVPATYRDAEDAWVGITGRVRVVAYDPEKVDEAELPDNVLDFAEPAWKGRVAIAPTNASFQSFVTALRVQEGDATAKKFLEDLQANDVKIYDNNLRILDALEAGEVEVGLTNHYYLQERKVELGAENVRTRLKFLPPGSAGALVNVAGVGVLESAAENANAAAFVEYLLSDEAQRKFVETTGEYPLVDVAGPEGLPTLAELGAGAGISLSELDSLEETVALLVEVGLI